jgi:murein DD-endopeptidase MepM/ murein hydrolase activator NlpD
VYLAIFAAIAGARYQLAAKAAARAASVTPWPISGPIGKLGGGALVTVFTLSAMLAILNPLQLIQAVRQSIGNSRAKQRAVDTPTEPPERATCTRYRLPFDGEWCVINGGITRDTSHSWGAVAQRYAYDFVIADEHRRRHRGAGTKVSDYYCYDRPILAAADGVVVAAETRIGRSPLVGFGVADALARHFAGNHVVIRHAEGEYGFYAHLVRGSVPLQIGQRVARGQEIGRCGHSGTSTEPHLHFHVQDREDFFSSAGVPVVFADLAVDGITTAAAYIRGGQRVTAL